MRCVRKTHGWGALMPNAEFAKIVILLNLSIFAINVGIH